MTSPTRILSIILFLTACAAPGLIGKAAAPDAIESIRPGKILGIVENYPTNDGVIPPSDAPALRKLGRLYGKFPAAVTTPDALIMRPPEARALRVDGQLVAVIGKRARHVTPAQALDHVAGYTLGADVSDAVWYRTARLVGRSTDTWAPVGPSVIPAVDLATLVVETRVNGELVESLAAREMILSVAELVSFFSRYQTLEPGDLIFTGSRHGSVEPTRPLQAGDQVEVSGGPLGILRNRVADLPPAPDWAAAANPAPAVTEERYVRFLTDDGARFGRLQSTSIEELEGDYLAGAKPTGAMVPLARATLLPPVRPAKIIGVIRNYFPPNPTDRTAPVDDLPSRLFLKWPGALATTGSEVELPPEAGNLNWEGELVVVIGRTARHVTVERALEHVFGYAVGNDISENHWGGLIGKATDTWAQIGPVVTTGPAWDNLAVTTHLNGQLVQAQHTADLRYGVPLLVAYASRYFTLEPGDLIYSGSVQRLPDVPKKFHVGDEIEVSIEGLGSVRNRIVPLPAPVQP